MYDTRRVLCVQIPWGDEHEHETARELFGSNVLALTWIKGEPMPGELVNDILRGLGLERETDNQQRRRVSMRRKSSLSLNRQSSSSLDQGSSPKARRSTGNTPASAGLFTSFE